MRGQGNCPQAPSSSTSATDTPFDRKNDSWGKKGKESIVAQLWSKTPGSAKIDENQTYSEVCDSSRAGAQ